VNFRIADTFTASLDVLANDEQKLVMTTAFDLQMNPASLWMRFHKLERAKDKSFWSVRVGSDLRLIVHKTEESLLLCNVAHHDAVFGTMHLAKGLEFRAVAVIACDDEILPQQERIETVGDEADLSDVYETERHLLYVACTRARDHLLVTGVAPASEFLDDMVGRK
jgi:mRNA-degrading endonuclease RelE of RelBE toxin-antitoxin system